MSSSRTKRAIISERTSLLTLFTHSNVKISCFFMLVPNNHANSIFLSKCLHSFIQFIKSMIKVKKTD